MQLLVGRRRRLWKGSENQRKAIRACWVTDQRSCPVLGTLLTGPVDAPLRFLFLPLAALAPPSVRLSASRAEMAGVDRVPPEGVLSAPRRSCWQRRLSTRAAQREKRRVCVGRRSLFLLNIPQI